MFKNTKSIIKIVSENTNCIILYGDLAKSRIFFVSLQGQTTIFVMNHDIFISYSSKQKSIADGVCHYLEENGFKCWMAPRDISVGSEYGDLIEEAIKTCKIVVLVFSQSASISKWVKGEINVAFTEDKPILPFRIDATEITGGFRVMLNQMHWIDAFPQYADRLPDLLNSVCGFLGCQPKIITNDNYRMEAERKAKDEAERARLERERLGRERRAEEAKRKAEQERLTEVQRRAELERANRLRVSDTPKFKSKKTLWIAFGAVAVVALVLVLVWPKGHNLSANGSYNGHGYVDLGLPSGTLWATCNVGASNPEGYGNYYAWGEIDTKSTYTLENYKFIMGMSWDAPELTKYCSEYKYGIEGFTDDLVALQESDDPATANWGNGWRTPSKVQWEELKNNTTNKWTRLKGVKGWLFTARNGASIFLPAADVEFYVGNTPKGRYWSRSLFTEDPTCAWGLLINMDGCSLREYYKRSFGFSIRPIREK